MSNKKPRKKHNPLKFYQAQADLAMRDKCLLMRLDVSEGKVNVFNYRTKTQIGLSPIKMKIAQNSVFNWTLVLVVYAYESNGKERVSAQLVQSPYPAIHTELITSLNDVHQNMIANEAEKGNTVYQAGWVAYPQNLGVLDSKASEQWIQLALNLLDIYYEQSK